MKKLVIALHGLQGSGKTTLAKGLLDRASGHECSTGVVSVKNSFGRYATTIMGDLGNLLPEHSRELAYKELQRVISTWGERFEPHIWSNLYEKNVRDSGHAVVLTDDVRTDMNMAALERLWLSDYNVLVVYLRCEEEVRKGRVSVWREVSDYTERMLSINPLLPSLVIDTGLCGRTEVLDIVSTDLENRGWL